jgi:hypothetical protein
MDAVLRSKESKHDYNQCIAHITQVDNIQHQSGNLPASVNKKPVRAVRNKNQDRAELDASLKCLNCLNYGHDVKDCLSNLWMVQRM